MTAVNVGSRLTPVRLAAGYVNSSQRATSSGTFTTTETVIQSVTWTAIAALRYEVSACQSYQSTAADDIFQMRLRYLLGATLVVAGSTQITSLALNCDKSGKGEIVTITESFTGVSGLVTAGVTGVRNFGSGTMSCFGAAGAQINTVTVKII